MTQSFQKQNQISQTLKKLYQIHSDLLRSSPNNCEQFLRNYINIYIQSHTFSEQIFIVFCQHKFLNKLLKDFSKNVPSLSIMEMLNLLISNIGKLDHLVYIFSQSIIHQYLFQKFNLEKQNSETIEYYTQLLKTIIMKISETKNDFLVKLFCNQRFPHFPLLTITTMLATNQGNQILAKITAQQSVLLMIKLINTKKVGLVYLNQLQMVIFYYQTIRQLLSQSISDDKEGLMRYLIDLILILHQNETSLLLLFNILINILFFDHQKQPAKILLFIRTLRNQFLQVQEFPKDQAQEIIKILYTIFIKYFCSHYINYTYFSAQKIIPSIQIPKQPNLYKFYQKRAQKINEFLINQQYYYNNEKEKNLIYEQWKYFNDKNINLSPIIEKKKSKSIQQLFNRSQTEDYVKNVMSIAGLSFQKIKDPISKLSWSVDFRTSVYLVQYVCKKYEQKPHIEEFMTDNQWKLVACIQIYSQIHAILVQLSRYNVDFFGKKKSILITQMQGQLAFTKAIRPQLMHMIVKNISGNTPISIRDLSIIHKLMLQFKLSEFIQQFIPTLLNKLKNLQIYISTELFQQQNYPYFLNYVVKNKQKKINKQKIEILFNDKTNGHVGKKKKFLIESSLLTYYVIINIIDESLKSINAFFHQFWVQNFVKSTQQEQQNDKVCYKHLLKVKDAKSNSIYVEANDKYQFMISYKLKQDNLLHTFVLSDKDCIEVPTTHPYVQFQGFNQKILMSSIQKAKFLFEDINKIRQYKKQILRNSILQYLQFTYLTLETIHANRKIRSQIFVTE